MNPFDRASLPPLQQYDRKLCESSSRSSFFSMSRRSSSSLISNNSEASSNSSQREVRVFKSISYQEESSSSSKAYTSTQDALRKYHSIERGYRAAINSLIAEKAEIRLSTKREKAHIYALSQENKEREANIKETLQILRSNSQEKKHTAKPPSIEQLRKIANTIMNEGMKFKKASECQRRIDREIEGIDDHSDELNLSEYVSGDVSLDREMEIQRSKLSKAVYKYENVKMRLETTLSNRDMLNRVIFDHNTNKEALKVKMRALTEENGNLLVNFDEELQKAAQILGEMMWKNEVVKACNKIAKLPKSL